MDKGQSAEFFYFLKLNHILVQIIALLPCKNVGIGLRDEGEQAIVLRLKEYDRLFWSARIESSTSLFANDGVSSGDGDCLCKLEGTVTDNDKSTIEHSTVEKLLPEGSCRIGSVSSKCRMTHQQIGSRNTDLIEDCVAIVRSVICHFGSATLRMMLHLWGGILTQHHPVQLPAWVCSHQAISFGP